jgi:hypothetical protein
VYQQRLTFAGK